MNKTFLIAFLATCLSTFNSIAQNALTGQNINLHATFHHVGVQVDIDGDDNNNASATMEVNINGEGLREVHPLSRAGENRFVGTVFSLEPETSLEVRVTLSDPDGVTNMVQTASITSRSRNLPNSEGNTIHVATSGSDSSGNGSMTNPYASIQYAVDQVTAGDIVLVHGGVYHEHVEFPFGEGGMPGNPITIRGAGDGDAILDGADPALKNPTAWTDEGNHIYSAPVDQTYYVGVDGARLWRYDTYEELQNLSFNSNGGFYVNTGENKVFVRLPGDVAPTGHQFQVSTLNHGLDLYNTSHIIVDNLVFRCYGAGQFSHAISLSDASTRVWIVNSTFEAMSTAIWLEGYVEDLVVMDNEFSDLGVNEFNWEDVKEYLWYLERGALFCSNDSYTGKGTIFYNNYVHDIFDGIKITGQDPIAYPNDSDIENNLFRHLSDDGIETDGYCSNVRVVNNRFENLLVGVSVAPAIGGPTYIMRNTFSDLNNVAPGSDFETTAVKFNVSDEPASGDIFIYHNTATTSEPNQAAFSVTNDCDWKRVTLKNNIWSGTAYGFYYWLSNTLPFEEDYDLLYSEDMYIALHQGIEYSTIADYNEATTLCPNCLQGDPLFLNVAGGDYNLSDDSPAIDKAIFIPGINDNFTGTAPDIGAIESGIISSTDDPNAPPFDQDKQLTIFPNPTKGVFTLKSTQMMGPIVWISETTGKKVFQKNFNGIQSNIDISHLPSGMYLISVQSSEGFINKKLLLQD